MPGKRRPQAAAPLVAEDKLLLLQSQALAEEEAAKRKRELLTQFLQDKLAKEKRDSSLNLHKLNTQWRGVLRETKNKELHQDVEILSQTFERVMDCKDSVIESLAADLEEAEEQHAQALRSHLHNVDRLLQLQRCRLTCLEEGYNAQLEALKVEFEAERRTILEQHEQESCFLRDVALGAEQNYAESDQETMLNFQSAWDDIKNKSLQEKQYSRTQLGGKVEVLWEQFQQTTQSYMEATEHQMAFETLKQKVERSSRDIELHVKKLQKLQDLVTATKGQITAHLRESEEQNRPMRERKEKLLRQLQELRSEINQARAKAHGSLARLTAQSGAALKTLVRVVEKGQRILRLAEMCRRLETEEEKVLPFYPSSLAEGEQQDAQRVLEEPPTESLAQAMQDYVGLERFWQRFSKAKLEEQALEREQAALRQRNRRLRELLQQYLAGISVSQEMLDQPSPLLAVEHKSCVPKDLPHAKVGRAAQQPPERRMVTQMPSIALQAPAESPPNETKTPCLALGDTAETVTAWRCH
ncbi:PREDICTED: coiled-coil domain-containing protein 65 [Calidris pugnax]|uniref:coiled-coil domain-containing protein 65 n=1 Tax=Calidris pugnax TaxID=198806 RepID=UPI00071DA5A5|nr:PREDICTED: coiled-coil domain-containing protein 65 [Calidris pugnax]